ncbi:MAG TPA: hypothetical protein PKW80_01100 [Bacteroidales bacterium]|nr:hypothetical protein [Bacteroidales bacterium]
MSLIFLSKIKSQTAAILKAHEVIEDAEAGQIDYSKANNLNFWSHKGLCFKLNYNKFSTGLMFFEILGKEELFDNEPSDAPLIIDGSHNETNKIVSDIFYNDYRIELSYDNGKNFIRKTYVDKTKSQAVQCDYNVLINPISGYLLNFQLTLSGAYNDPQGENKRIEYHNSIFFMSEPHPSDNTIIDYQTLFVVEKNCSLMTIYNPIKKEPFPMDKRNTYVFRFNKNWVFEEAYKLFMNKDQKCWSASMDAEEIKSIFIPGFGFDPFNTTFNFNSSMENIMKGVDDSENIDLKKCIIKNYH